MNTVDTKRDNIPKIFAILAFSNLLPGVDSRKFKLKEAIIKEKIPVPIEKKAKPNFSLSACSSKLLKIDFI